MSDTKPDLTIPLLDNLIEEIADQISSEADKTPIEQRIRGVFMRIITCCREEQFNIDVTKLGRSNALFRQILGEFNPNEAEQVQAQANLPFDPHAGEQHKIDFQAVMERLNNTAPKEISELS